MAVRTALTGTMSVLAAVTGPHSRRALAEQLLTVSGANRDVLRDAPKERTKQVAMGAVLVSSAGIATVSGRYAFHVALQLPWVVAVVAGLAWGLVILILDRWLVVSSPRLKTKLGTIAMALPRMLLAVLIGAVVSTPLTLAVFSSEINAQIKVMAAEEENSFNEQLNKDSRFTELPALRDQRQGLEVDLQDG